MRGVTTSRPYPRLDPTALKVLAHPLRSRLLGELRLNGPATATTLANVLGTNTGATSYHLRKLASVGLVEETGEGKGRERWWRPTHEMHSWFTSDLDEDPDGIAPVSLANQAAAFASISRSWRNCRTSRLR